MYGMANKVIDEFNCSDAAELARLLDEAREPATRLAVYFLGHPLEKLLSWLVDQLRDQIKERRKDVSYR